MEEVVIGPISNLIGIEGYKINCRQICYDYIIDMSDQVFGAGRNIKCHDKLKLQNVSLKVRLHTQNKYYRNGSLNQIISCHRQRNNSDWFVVRPSTREEISPNHTFKNGDLIVLTHSVSKKNIHTADEYDSPISQQCEVSACMNSEAATCCPEDEWKVELVEGRDQYWRVGDIIRLINVRTGKYLCTHKKQLEENKEYEVFVPKKNEEGVEGESKNSQWIVCEQEPYIFTAPIVSNVNKSKKPEDLDQLQELKEERLRRNINQKKVTFQEASEQQDKLKMKQLDNQFTRMVQTNKLKFKQRSCWKKYICCCFYPEPKNEQEYLQLF